MIEASVAILALFSAAIFAAHALEVIALVKLSGPGDDLSVAHQGNSHGQTSESRGHKRPKVPGSGIPRYDGCRTADRTVGWVVYETHQSKVPLTVDLLAGPIESAQNCGGSRNALQQACTYRASLWDRRWRFAYGSTINSSTGWTSSWAAFKSPSCWWAHRPSS